MEIQDWLGSENQLGIDIWNNKYRNDGETFDQWLDRISGGDAELRKLQEEKKFLFGGRILANRGLENAGRKITLSNCYVVTPPQDSLEDIFECAKKLARTYSYGGGCGIDVSGLSPRGAHINNAAKETSGAVSFMELYALTTSLIGQNGRRGALMISLDSSHPDVEDFIRLKTDLDKVTKANLSVRVHNDFFEAVQQGRPYRLHYTRETTGEEVAREVDARALFRLIAETNWDYAEPGALFWDRITGWNLLSEEKRFSYAGVNPCAEEPLPAGGSCLLGSLNLASFALNPFTELAAFDFEAFRHCVRVCVRGMNDVLDEGLPLHPLEEQRESVRSWRQIGLGIMGLADLLIKLGITYGSAEAAALCDQIGFAMADTAIAASAELAAKDGPFPMCDTDAVFASPYFQQNTTEATRALVRKHGLRNSQLLTIAPTGTLSTMLGISGGIEPVFANSYERRTQSLHGTDVSYKVYTKIVETYMQAQGLTEEEQLPGYFVTARMLPYEQRVEMQSVWQTHIDASISSTVNVPESFTVEETEKLYLYAWQKGLKGITLYREGCRRGAILTVKEPEKPAVPVAGVGLGRGQIMEVSDDVIGKKRRLITGCGTLHCMAMFDPQSGALVETYLNKGSTGGCNNFMIGLSRMISMAARGGIDIYTIVDQLNSTGSCPSYAVRHAAKKDTSRGACCPMAVGNALLEMYNEVQAELALRSGEKPVKRKKVKKPVQPTAVEDVRGKVLCPECGEPLIFEGGCNVCRSCGWSKCF